MSRITFSSFILNAIPATSDHTAQVDSVDYQSVDTEMLPDQTPESFIKNPIQTYPFVFAEHRSSISTRSLAVPSAHFSPPKSTHTASNQWHLSSNQTSSENTNVKIFSDGILRIQSHTSITSILEKFPKNTDARLWLGFEGEDADKDTLIALDPTTKQQPWYAKILITRDIHGIIDVKFYDSNYDYIKTAGWISIDPLRWIIKNRRVAYLALGQLVASIREGKFQQTTSLPDYQQNLMEEIFNLYQIFKIKGYESHFLELLKLSAMDENELVSIVDLDNHHRAEPLANFLERVAITTNIQTAGVRYTELGEFYLCEGEANQDSYPIRLSRAGRDSFNIQIWDARKLLWISPSQNSSELENQYPNSILGELLKHQKMASKQKSTLNDYAKLAMSIAETNQIQTLTATKLELMVSHALFKECKGIPDVPVSRFLLAVNSVYERLFHTAFIWKHVSLMNSSSQLKSLLEKTLKLYAKEYVTGLISAHTIQSLNLSLDQELAYYTTLLERQSIKTYDNILGLSSLMMYLHQCQNQDLAEDDLLSLSKSILISPQILNGTASNAATDEESTVLAGHWSSDIFES